LLKLLSRLLSGLNLILVDGFFNGVYGLCFVYIDF